MSSDVREGTMASTEPTPKMTKETAVTLTRLSRQSSHEEQNGWNNSKPHENGTEANGMYTAGQPDGKTSLDRTDDHKEKKKKGRLCCGGRSEEGEKKEIIGILELFQFATCTDKFLIVIGTIGAIALGTAFPINISTFGDVIDVFVDNNMMNKTNTTQMLNKTTTQPIQDAILPYIYQFIGLGVGSFITGFFAVSFWQWAAERQVTTMRKQFFRAVLRQDIGWFDVHEAGEISSKFSEDISKISEGMGDKMAIFLQWVTTWLAAYIMAFTRSWKLTLAVIAVSPILVMVGATFVRVMRNMASQEAKAYAKAGAIAEQTLRAIRTVQAFQGQEKEVAKYDDNLSTALQVATKKGIALGLGNSMIWFILLLMFSGVMWFGTYLLQADGLQSGKILPVFFGIMVGSFALGNAFNNLESFSNARGAAVSVFKIISLVPKINSFSEEGLKLQNLKGHIEFKNIKFSYPARPDVQILKDLNIKIEPGKKIALVGPSGCGKSTTVQLLQRFYDPTEGTVLIDGTDIRKFNVKWMRSNIGVVSQEPSLFDASIEENIRFGKMDATLAEIQAAAKKANAHDFIMQLPEGYKTNVGERGAQLSGGQKQRISIARALVRNPKILLLDEATSALDQESEAVVQDALEAAGEGRTTITIAHRLSTIQNADEIIAISEGEVIERGTHQELMEKKGLYFQLVEIQSQIKKEAEMMTKVEIKVTPQKEDMEDVEIIEEDELDTKESANQELLRRSFSRISGKEIKEKNLVARASFNKGKKSKQKNNKVNPENEEGNASIKELMRYNAPEWPLILFGCVGSMLAGVVHPAFTFILSEFIKLFGIKDHNEQWEKVHVLGGAVIGVACVSAVVRMLQGYCFSKSGAFLTARLRKLTFASMINQDMDYFDMPNNQVGALSTKLSGDAALVQGATGSKIGQMLESISTITAALVIAFIYGWKLTLVVLSFMPLMIIGGIIQGRAIAGANNSEKKQIQQAGKICSEVVDSIRTVVSLGREDYFLKRFDDLIDSTEKASRNMSLIYGLTYAIANCIIFFAYAVAFYYGSVLVNDGEMEFFEVFRVFSAIIFGGMTIGRQSSFGADFTKAKVAGARIIALINRKPKIDVRNTDGIKMDSFTGHFTFANVSYNYPSRPNAKVLNGLNLEIQPGETVAFVGASGCGKSTSVQLIERFYDVILGNLLIDGNDIRTLNLKWYRSQLGIVSQEPTLFDCSIAENIAYGDNSRIVPMSDIMQAAKDANIHNFIASLPQGYETSVGEKGAQLSGGQKQRIAIARALVRRPKVLLLDEATSALDSESEKIVQEALDKACKDRTCITIAHRLSTIQNSDKIAVISKGRIVEIGSHSQLLSTKGAYYRLLTAQSRAHK
ncbi:ATP-dependent translocase ABCB1-like isoform X1 [Biomphalaria glabrata]|uniref:ATP-dependent translocase ABCB1-like isoform X1 n=3 Tax=Biomphalaria glabrata TaxID=6526 RepID=A0A9W2ZPR1_BIOGL|nr:ATP-dependent translocase ABCB1-like isoform X1 [Biomphalaria glabrata]